MIWHYHSIDDGHKFPLDHLIQPSEECPVCKRQFARRIKFNCGGCNTIYYTDKKRRIGDKFICPINGEPVVVTLSWKIVAIIILIAAALYFLFLLINWLIGSIVPLTAIAVAVIIPIVTNLIETGITLLKLVGLVTVLIVGGAVIAAGTYVVLHVALGRPAQEFGNLYDVALQRTQTLGVGERAPFKKALDRSRKIVMRQDFYIGLLVVGMMWGGLICYLAINTVQEARQLLGQVTQMGVINTLIFAVLYYGAEFYLQLDTKLVAQASLPRGVVVVALFGTATVLTMIGLILLGETFTLESVVAVGLTLNVTTSVCTLLYGSAAKLALLKDIRQSALFSMQRRFRLTI